METSGYCGKHEWSDGMGGPCPDCAELNELKNELAAAVLQIEELKKFSLLFADGMSAFTAGKPITDAPPPNEKHLAYPWICGWLYCRYVAHGDELGNANRLNGEVERLVNECQYRRLTPDDLFGKLYVLLFSEKRKDETRWCTCVPNKDGTHQPDCVGEES